MDERAEEQLELAEIERDDVEDAHTAEVDRQRTAWADDDGFEWAEHVTAETARWSR